jgi:hypothetical protein
MEYLLTQKSLSRNDPEHVGFWCAKRRNYSHRYRRKLGFEQCVTLGRPVGSVQSLEKF